jgi:hypothetical protein
MKRFVKKIRNVHELRGYYSYLLEALIEIMRAYIIYPNDEIVVYFDLIDVHHYMQKNLFDVCFEQDDKDYKRNRNLYENLETVKKVFHFEPYILNEFPQELRVRVPNIIKKHFKLKQEYLNEINLRLSSFDPLKTIGVHRRATDMIRVHYQYSPKLTKYFEVIDSGNYDNIFLMSDNQKDIDLFKEKYRDKLICFEDGVTSDDSGDPYFLLPFKSPESTKKHIEEITMNTFILSKLSKLIFTSSNLSTFAVMINPNLEYQKIN